MPRFTLIKHAEQAQDAEVKMTFEADLLDLAQAHFTDFLQASGFEIPPTDEETELDFEHILNSSDWIASEEDWMWDDAVDSKFSFEDIIDYPAKSDHQPESTKNDVIKFPSRN